MLLGSSTRRLVTVLTGELVARFDVLAAALLETEIFRVVTVCRRVNSFGCFKGSCLQL